MTRSPAVSVAVPPEAEANLAVMPNDPMAFVAAAERATNTCDTDWVLSMYSPVIRLELAGDGILDVHDGFDAVRPVVLLTYRWMASVDAHIEKTLIAASHGTVVNRFQGTLFGGRQTTHGAELWRFDETGKVVHNALFSTVNPRPSLHPVAGVRMLLGHPRAALTHTRTRLRRG